MRSYVYLVLTASILIAGCGQKSETPENLPPRLARVIDLQMVPGVPYEVLEHAALEIAGAPISEEEQVKALKAQIALLSEASALLSEVRTSDRVATLGSLAGGLASGLSHDELERLLREGGKNPAPFVDKTVALLGTGMPLDAAIIVAKNERQ